MFLSVEENIELVAILTFSSGLLGNRSSERLWSFSNELILSVVGEWLKVSTVVGKFGGRVQTSRM